MNFPSDLLYLALQQHLAARVIQVQGFPGNALQVSRSILQGCRLSVTFTKLYMLRDLIKLRDKHPQANISIHVDDTSFDTSTDSLEGCAKILVPLAMDFAQQVIAKKLKLSTKGVVVANSAKRAKILSKELASYGIVMKPALPSRDLGITYAAGSRRPAVILDKRLHNVRKRILKIKNLAKISKNAKKLFSGSAYAAATWGHQAAGLVPSQLLRLERQALDATGISAHGRCRLIAVTTVYGLQGTPHARLIRETVNSWFDILTDSNVNLHEVAEAWLVAKRFLYKQRNPTHHVSGIMSNIICMLITLGWVPHAYNYWRDQNGNLWNWKALSNCKTLVYALIKTAHARQLSRAAQHHDGLGIENGINWDYTLRYVRALRKIPNLYSHRAALETIMSGACWPAARVASINPLFSSRCMRCGAEVETSLHTFWTCPANNNLTEEEVTSTQGLIPAAERQANVMPCFWLRGLMPDHMSYIEDEPTTQLIVTYDGPGQPSWGSGTYYGDGSGGEFTSHPLLRRCGVGISTVDAEGSLVFAASMNLPGKYQTVPRAEYFAFFYIINLAEPRANILYVTDHEPLKNVFDKGRDAAAESINHDLLVTVFDLVQEKGLTVSIRWIPSHLEEETLPPDISRIDFLGNQCADKYAKKAARAVSLPLHVTAPVLYRYSLLKRIQKRLAIILCNLPNRPRQPKPPITPRIDVDSVMGQSQHVAYESGSRVWCARCRSSFKRSPVGPLVEWLRSPCSAIGTDVDRPVPLPYEVCHIGNQTVCYSHSLRVLRGLLFCAKCGAISQGGKLGKLGRDCAPPGPYGLRNKKYLLQGRLPPGVSEWLDSSTDGGLLGGLLSG